MHHPSPIVPVGGGRHRLPERVAAGGTDRIDGGAGRWVPTVRAPASGGREPRHLRSPAEQHDIALLRRILAGLHAQL